MSSATRKIRVKKYGPRGRPYWTTQRGLVPYPPPVDKVCGNDLFDPITKTKIPNVQRLIERLNEILDDPPADDRYFDPCSKRLMPNLAALRERVNEIACWYVPPRWMYKEYYANKEDILRPQLHQEIIVEGICKQYRKENPDVDFNTSSENYPKDRDNRYLIGVLPRGGKTYIAGGIMLSHLCFSISYDHTILWITAAPNETRMQVQKDLIGKFPQFQKYEFVDVKSGERYQKSRYDDTTGVIYFVSSQLLSLHSTGHVRERRILNEIFTAGNVDLIFFDEAHKTGSGATTREQLDKIIHLNPKAPVIFLTATYYNVQKEYNIPKEKTFLWDYTDVLAARNLGSDDEIVQSKAYEALTSRFNSGLVDEVLRRRSCDGESFESMSKSYADYPDLHFLSADFNPDALDQFEQAGIFSEDDGFDMGKLLKIRDGASIVNFKTKGGKIIANAFEQFDDIDLVSDFIQLLGEYVLPRIHTISQSSGSRFNLAENPSLMMFMPTGRKGTNIFFTLVAWATALMAADWWNDRYEVVCVVENETMPKDVAAVNNTTVTTQSSIHIVSKNVKETILDLEQKAHSRGKGLIILAGEKMSMGVSLPFVDVVMMLNDKFSPDDIIQKMYRAVTPDAGKKTAFIVDFTPERTLTAIYGYTKAASPDSLSPAKVLEILLNTYYWDVDIIPRNATERNLLLAHRNTFQGSLRKLYHNAIGNKGEKMAALEAEIQRIQGHFLGKERKAREKVSLNYKNLVHPNNRAVLDPMQNVFQQRKANVLTLQESMRKSPTEEKAAQLKSLLQNFKTYSKSFANAIVETRKRRKALNSAETKKVKRPIALTEAQAAKAAEKERQKAEAAAAKAAATAAKAAEKQRREEEAAAAKVAAAAAKAAQKAEKDRLKVEAAAAKAAATAARKAERATRTRKAARPTPAAAPAEENHSGNTTEEEN